MDKQALSKEAILDEIHRLAAAYGGQAPGSRRFRTATGISESQWGRYWVRWSDALREAGFSANTWGNPRDEIVLLTRFIGVIREQGRIPTNREIQLMRRTDPTVPVLKTLRAHFGPKPALLKRARTHCQRYPEFRDVLEICDAAPAANPIPARRAPEIPEEYVYLLKSGYYYKIGRTNSPGRRTYELALQLPEKATTVHSIKTDDPVGVEAYWHRRFAACRKNGEFFKLMAKDVRAFKRWRRI